MSRPFFLLISRHTYHYKTTYSVIICCAYILLRLISSVHSRIHIVLYSNACMVRRSFITFTFHLLDKGSQFIVISSSLARFFPGRFFRRDVTDREMEGKEEDIHRICGIELHNNVRLDTNNSLDT